MPGFTINTKMIKRVVLIPYDTIVSLWLTPRIVKLNDEKLLEIFNLASAANNYAFSLFEGEKARRSKNDKDIILMPTLQWNWQRFNKGIKFLETKPVPWEFYEKAHILLIREYKKIMPDYPEEYYIRPMFGMGPQLGMKLLTTAPRGIGIFGTPVSGYYPDLLKIHVITDQIRCMPGGTGWIKISGNYPNSMESQRKARENGCDEALFLDERLLYFPKSGGIGNVYKDRLDDILRCGIQELSLANICFIKDGVLYSPYERDTILPSTTKQRIFQIAKSLLKMNVMDNLPLILKELTQADEAFACGTAAGIAPIGNVKVLDHTFRIGNGRPGKITQEIKKHLMDIYWGEKDPFGWMFKIEL